MNHKALPFDKKTILRLKKICKQANWSYIRIFGSALKNIETARDIDIIVPHGPKNLQSFARVTNELEKIFNKKIDLIFLDTIKSPRLILEILSSSKMLYVSPAGLEQFTLTADRIHAVATEEILRYPPQEQLKNMKELSRRLDA